MTFTKEQIENFRKQARDILAEFRALPHSDEAVDLLADALMGAYSAGRNEAHQEARTDAKPSG